MQTKMGNDEAVARATALIQDLRRVCIGHTDSLPIGNALYVAVSATFKLIVILAIEMLEHELGHTPHIAEVVERLSNAPVFDEKWIERILKEHIYYLEKLRR